jgi:hypothetical protein
MRHPILRKRKLAVERKGKNITIPHSVGEEQQSPELIIVGMA